MKVHTVLSWRCPLCGCRALCVDVEEGADTLWQAELLQDGPSPHSDDHGGLYAGPSGFASGAWGDRPW